MDIEKIKKGLQIERECVSRDCDRDCGKCDLVQDRDWLLSVYDDAITLLEEQEPKYVNSIAQQISCFSGTCPKCGKMLNTTCNKNFCGDCGQAVKWND